ncbi:MAG: hypothetical protein NC084_09975 [Bacteroides sp.]|nr:hypothetical protein [Eubacterium sp.]MCM1419375.1 hypothetical protein [Roseburia sp.]MCM1463026.1 hypothetical protein [Bacteroides sp.]
MKRLRRAAAGAFALLTALLADLSASAKSIEDFPIEDRMIFGVFPLWVFLLLLAGIVAAAIIIIVEIVKRKMK